VKRGLDYFFVSDDAFREQIQKESFVEWVENYGHYYGTSKEFMQDILCGGSDLLLDIENPWG